VYSGYKQVFYIVSELYGQKEFFRLFKDLEVFLVRKKVDEKLGRGMFDKIFADFSKKSPNAYPFIVSDLYKKVEKKYPELHILDKAKEKRCILGIEYTEEEFLR
jgi:hypothetical protein